MTSTLAIVALSMTLEGWVAANAAPSEPVICQREVDGDYFFVARRADDDKLRLGSRVDLTGFRPETLSFGVSWRLSNENDTYITAKIQPTVIKEEYHRADGKAYAENIEYQTINLGRSKALRVQVAVDKCPAHPCAEGSTLARRYMIDICEIAL